MPLGVPVVPPEKPRDASDSGSTRTGRSRTEKPDTTSAVSDAVAGSRMVTGMTVSPGVVAASSAAIASKRPSS